MQMRRCMGMRSKMFSFKTGLLFLFAMVSSFSRASTDAQYVLRSDKTKCGFYIAKLSSEFTGRKISDDLDTTKLKERLKDFDPVKERLVAVGTPPDRASRTKLRAEILAALADAGYPSAKTALIRHIGNYIESKVGVFVSVPGKGMTRLGGLHDQNLAVSLSGPELKSLIDAGGSVVISGTPIFGPSRAKIKANVQGQLEAAAKEVDMQLDERFIKMQSKAQVWARAFAENPKKAYLESWYYFRSLFPYSEDFVTPTAGEIKSTGQKVTMHTFFTLVSFGIKGDSLDVVVPMTIVNGANSAGTGTYRSIIGNWFSRNGSSMAIRTIKGLMMSSFFTFDLYLARHAFDGNVWASLTELSGWSHFVATSWVSVLFQAVWRTPVSSVLNSWERWKSEVGGPEASAMARNVAGNSEKFMTYLMTQFYIVSLVVKSSFFNIVWNSGHGIGIIPGSENVHSELGQTLLMNFNVGHFAMATVGAAALMFKNKYKYFDKVVPVVNWLDDKETRGYRAVVNGAKKTFQIFRPKAKDVEPDAKP